MIWLGIVFTALAGWAVAPWVRPVLLYFPIGAAALSLELLLYDLARIPWTRLTVIAPWVPLIAWRQWRRRARWPRPRPSLPGWLEWPPLLFGAAVLLAWIPYERLMPLNEWDAIMLWMFKGKVFYLDGGIAPYLGRAHEFLGNPAYPLLVPLYATFLYICTGGVADHAAKLLSPCFYASLLGGFYCLARRFAPRTVAAVFTGMLAGVHIVNVVAFHYAGYADTAIAASVLMGAGFLYAWFREDQYRDFVLAVGFAAIGAWTKNEGLFFLAGLGTLAAARLAWKRTWNGRYWVTLAGLPALAVVPWAVARALYGIRRPGQLSSEILRTNVESYWPTLRALIEHAFSPSTFNLVFPLWLVGILLYRRAGLDRTYLLVPGLVLWQMAGVVLVYVTGPVRLDWMIGSSLDRVLSQVAPLALWSAALVCGSWYAAQEARLAAADQPAREPRPVRSKGKKKRGGA